MANENKLTFFQSLKQYWLLYLFVVGSFLLVCYTCECRIRQISKSIIQKDTLTPLNTRYSQIIDSVTKSASNRNLKADKDTIRIHHIKYITKVVEIIKQAPDTCTPYLNELYRISNEQDSLMGRHILRQDSTIQDQFVGLMFYKAVAHNDTIRMGQLSDSCKSEFKRGKRVGRKQGFVAGVLITECVNVGARAIKP